MKPKSAFIILCLIVLFIVVKKSAAAAVAKGTDPALIDPDDFGYFPTIVSPTPTATSGTNSDGFGAGEF